MSYFRGFSSLLNFYKSSPLLILKRSIKQTVTASLFLSSPPISIRFRVFQLFFNKYSISIIATIDLRLAIRKKIKANAKGVAGNMADDSVTPFSTKNKRKLIDEEGSKKDLNTIDVDSGDEHSGVAN